MEITAEKPHNYSKAELARLCGVTGNTIGYWLNTVYYDQLLALGYRKSQKVLTPIQWSCITKKLVVID